MSTHESPVAIVTGAGSGVGRALALQLAKFGYRCALAGRTAETLDETARLFAEAAAAGAEAAAIPTDLADADATKALVERTVDTFGRVDALANVAGYAPLQPIPKITGDLLRQTLAVNFEAVVTLTQACWPHFKAQGGGVVASVSSKASVDPFTGFNIYGSAKAAVNLFTKAAADEGKAAGILAYCIAPGAIETGMLRSMFNEKMLPRDKTLDPAQVAQALADCITGETTMQSGETFVMDSP